MCFYEILGSFCRYVDAMKWLVAVLFACLLLPVGKAVDLSLDASKKVAPKIIRPETRKAKTAEGVQEKRFRSKEFKQGKRLFGSKRFSTSKRSASESLNPSNGKKASLANAESLRTTEILEQTVRSSEDFEKAYREALKVELSKRAAAQVEVSTPKATVNQGDVNRDAQARQRGPDEGFVIQRAGSESSQ